jgi:two-component system nitrogen regulation response regulator NtrX
MSQILVVDDEVGIRELLSEILEDEGHEVRLAEDARAARAARGKGRPDLVLLDIWMPETDGITLLREWADSGQLTMPVVMMSGHGTIDTAVEATRIGAFDFLEKPIAMHKLLAAVCRALSHAETAPKRNLTLASLGRSPLVTDLKQRLERVANLRHPVLLTCEPGSGAELCAQFLHRPPAPWFAVEDNNLLAQSPEDVLEKVREGTLFISEIGNLGREEQRGLLTIVGLLAKYSTRLICATTRPLMEQVKRGEFDANLFHDLSQVVIGVPRLCDYRGDIPDLANLLLAREIESSRASPKRLSTGALNALRNYDWPGNLRQLENAMKTLVLTSANEEISVNDVGEVLSQYDAQSNGSGVTLPLHLDFKGAREAFERVYFEFHISREGGNMSRVAEKVGLERTHLYRKLKQIGVKVVRRQGDLT